MKKSLFISLILLVLFCGIGSSEPAKKNDQLAAKYKNVLRISAFVTAGDVMKYLDTKEKLEKASQIMKSLGVTRVFLDVYRGIIPDRKVLEQARDFFKNKGFDVGAGITTVQGKEFGIPSPNHRYFLCYDNDKTRADMKMISEYAASIFDTIIVDDFFATQCKCEECGTNKGNRAWDQYFRDVLVGISREQVVGAAHAKNKNAKVIIKYPQWYDRFHVFGYDLSRQPEIFDLVWAGTETRDPDKENVQQYEAFVNYSWIKSIAGKKMRGAWFDQLNTSPDTYAEQAYQSVLAGAQEITLFGFTPQLFTNSDAQKFADTLPYLFKVATAIKGVNPVGVPAYKPVNSNGGSENYVFDYLGMFGIPLIPTAVYPADAKTLILTEYAAADPDIVEKIKSSLNSGATIMMSSGLIEKLKKNEEILSLAGIDSGVKKMKGKYSNSFITDDGEVSGIGYIEIGVKLPVAGAKILAVADIDGEKYPILTVNEHQNKGKIVVFNATTFSFPEMNDGLTVPFKVLYMNLADKIAKMMRDLATQPIGLTISSPTKTAFYNYGYKYFAIDNFNDFPSDVFFKIDKSATGCDVKYLKDIYDDGKSYPQNDGTMKLKIPERSMHIFEIQYQNGCVPREIKN